MKIKTILRFLTVRAKKAVGLSREGMKLEHYLNPKLDLTKIVRHETPCEYIVLDDFFSDEAYEGICSFVRQVKERGVSESPSTSAFYPFKYVTGYLEKYGGYFYPPRAGENAYMDIFFSLHWNAFIEKLMGQMTNEFVSTTIHWHTPGNKDGWVHNDYQKVFFNRKDTLQNGMVVQSNTEKEFTDEAARAIAVLYYFDNDEWKDGDGGETGLFANPEKPPTTTVSPRNNRLFVMNITPTSFHAFMGNKVSRNAIVQWFHIDTDAAKSEFGYI